MSNQLPKAVFVPKAMEGLTSFRVNANGVYGDDVKYVRADIAENMIKAIRLAVRRYDHLHETRGLSEDIEKILVKATEIPE